MKVQRVRGTPAFVRNFGGERLGEVRIGGERAGVKRGQRGWGFEEGHSERKFGRAAKTPARHSRGLSWVGFVTGLW